MAKRFWPWLVGVAFVTAGSQLACVHPRNEPLDAAVGGPGPTAGAPADASAGDGLGGQAGAGGGSGAPAGGGSGATMGAGGVAGVAGMSGAGGPAGSSGQGGGGTGGSQPVPPACQEPCALPNARTRCAGDTCTIVECQAGFADCEPAAPGCETELASDPDHCARCGTSCLGGPCSAGVCGPVTLAAVGSVAAIAVDDDMIYMLADGRVEGRRRAPSGEVVFTNPTSDPEELQRVANRLYWSQSRGGVGPMMPNPYVGEIAYCTLPTCASVQLLESRPTIQFPHLRTDPARDRLFYTTRPIGYPLGGGPDTRPTTIQVHTPATGETRQLGSMPIYITTAAADAGFFYWYDIQERTIFKISAFGGGTASPLLRTRELLQIMSMAAAPQALFFNKDPQNDRGPAAPLYAIPLPGGVAGADREPPVFQDPPAGSTYALNGSLGYDLLVDGDSVLWIQGMGEPSASILRCPTRGCQGAPEIVAQEPQGASHLHADTKGLFWVRGRTTVVMLPKR